MIVTRPIYSFLVQNSKINSAILMHPPDAPEFCSGVRDHEVLFLIFQAAASTYSPLPGPDVLDAWPPVE